MNKLISIPFIITLFAVIGFSSLQSCYVPNYDNLNGAYSFADGLNNSITSTGTFELNTSLYSSNTTIINRFNLNGFTVDKILKRQETNKDRFLIVLAHDNNYYKLIYQYSKTDKTKNEVNEYTHLTKKISSYGVNYYESNTLNWNGSTTPLRFFYNNNNIIIPYSYKSSGTNTWGSVIKLGNNSQTYGFLRSIDLQITNISEEEGAFSLDTCVGSGGSPSDMKIGNNNNYTEAQAVLSGNDLNILLNESKTFTCTNPTVEIQSSGGVKECEEVSSIPATCVLTNQDNGNTYLIESNADQSYNTTTSVYVGVKGVTRDYQLIYNKNKDYYGAHRPADICWDINQLGVGSSSLSSLDYEKILDDQKKHEGIKIDLKSSNAYWNRGWGLVSHWYKSGRIGETGVNKPVVMAGKYATPVVIAMTPEYVVDPNNIIWDYEIHQTDPNNMYNDFNNEKLWKDGKFHIALAFNKTDYIVYNMTWNESIQGWVRVVHYDKWADLRTELETYGVSSSSIDQLLTDWDMSTPFNYVQESNKVTLKGYVWGTLKETQSLLGDSYQFDKPSCASDLNATVFNCDSSLIKQDAFPDESLCGIPKNVERSFSILTPSIEIYPFMNAEVTLNSYSKGTAQVTKGNYTYSCTSSDSSQTKTGSFVLNTDYFTLPITFTDVNSQPIGYILTIKDSQGNPQSLVQVITQYGTQVTNTSGQVSYLGIRENENLNVTLKFLTHTVNYVGSNSLAIGDSWNSQRYSDSGYCGGFDGYYRYTLDLFPTILNKHWTVMCGSAVVPDANINIDGVYKNTTNINGEAGFTVIRDFSEEGFQVNVTSKYGDTESTLRNLEDTYTFHLNSSCKESELISEGHTQKAGTEFILNKFADPMLISFLIVMAISIAVGYFTGSIELSLITLTGLLIVLYFLNVIPLFVVLFLTLMVAGFFAYQFTRG